MTSSRGVRMAGNTVAAAWIFGGGLFFFCRFTMAFYQANWPAIHSALDRLSQLVD